MMLAMGPLEEEIEQRVRRAVQGHPAAMRALVEGSTVATTAEKLDMAWRYLNALHESVMQIARRLDQLDERP
jgi:hypothetical protein